MSCPKCCAKPVLRTTESPDWCTANGRDPRPHHAPHRERLEKRQAIKDHLIAEGERAKGDPNYIRSTLWF